MEGAIIDIYGAIPQRGDDRPALKYLHRHVRRDIADNWYNVGMELLDAENEHVLNAINHNNPGDPMECTSAMFRLWLERQPGASWNQLIEALKAPSIRLEALAFKIEGMLLEDPDIYQVTSKTQKMTLHDDNIQEGSDCQVDFTKYTVTEAFAYLMTQLHRNIQSSALEIIKTMCMHVSQGRLRNLFKEINSVDSLFELLEHIPKCCNWMNIRLLEVIVISSNNKNLLKLIQNYAKSIYSRPLKQVFETIPNFKVKTIKLLSEYKDLEFKNLDDMKVEELLPFIS